jgi:hypothetical protein
VVAGKKAKQNKVDQFPPLNTQDTNKEMGTTSLQQTPYQFKTSSDPTVDLLAKRVAQLELMLEKQTNTLEALQQLMMTFFSQATSMNSNQVPPNLQSIVNNPGVSMQTNVSPNAQAPSDMKANNNKISEVDISMDIQDEKTKETNLPSSLTQFPSPNTNLADHPDVQMTLAPTTGKHSRDDDEWGWGEEDENEEDHTLDKDHINPLNAKPSTTPEQSRTSGPMDRFIKPKTPLPAPNDNVQRGGTQ